MGREDDWGDGVAGEERTVVWEKRMRCKIGEASRDGERTRVSPRSRLKSKHDGGHCETSRGCKSM